MMLTLLFPPPLHLAGRKCGEESGRIVLTHGITPHPARPLPASPRPPGFLLWGAAQALCGQVSVHKGRREWPGGPEETDGLQSHY